MHLSRQQPFNFMALKLVIEEVVNFLKVLGFLIVLVFLLTDFDHLVCLLHSMVITWSLISGFRESIHYYI